MKRFWILFLIGILAIVVFAPWITGAWFLNAANADIAHALTAVDSAQGDALLTRAQAELDTAKSFSDDERITLAQMRVLFARDEYERAAKTYESATASLRADSIARYFWGLAALQSQQSSLAFEHWRDGGAFILFSQNAHRALDKHDWRTAQDLARIGVGIDPMDAEMHYVLGFSLLHLDAYDPNALNEADLAIRYAPNDELLSTYLSLKGEILNAQGNWQIALNVFETARGVAPIDARPRTDLAMLWLKRQPNRQNDAIALLTEVVNDSPWYTAAYIALADVSEKQGDLKQAEVWLQKGLDKNPNNADMFFALGKFYTRQKRTDDARTMLIQAQKIETRIDIIPQIENTLADLGAK